MFTKQNLLSIFILLGLDLVWLKLFMGPQYRILIKKIQGSKMNVNYLSAAISYFIMVIGLIFFITPNINKKSNFIDYIRYPFLFGIIVYGVYDFTCGAVFEKWDFKLAIIDVLWGGFVYFISTYLGNYITNF